MDPGETNGRPSVQAIILADQLYRDSASGKHVIAGTFHQINVQALPGMLPRSIGLFLVLADLPPRLALTVELVVDGEVVMALEPVEISHPGSEQPLEIALEIPPLPLPRAGRYALRVLGDHQLLAEAPLDVVVAAETGTP